MASRWGRFLRGWLTASVAVFVAAVSHLAAGGAAPGPVGLALALAFSGMVCVALAGKTLSVLRSGLSVAFSQIVFHLLFGLGTSGAPSMVGTGSGHHLPMTMSPGTAAAADSIGMAAAGAGVDVWMWAAHATGAVLTILALHRGERAFWFLVELAASGLAVVLHWGGDLVPVAVRVLLAPAVAADEFVPTPFDTLRSSLTRRGPPATRIVF